MTRTTKADGIWRNDLWCHVISLSYDFVRRRGRLEMEGLNCCDMAGCVALFKRIDPAVFEVQTFAAGKPDTIYRRGGKMWRAFLPMPFAKGATHEHDAG